MGTLQALLTELSGLKKPRGFLNRLGPPRAGHAAEAAAEVPDSRHDGDEHARDARRGAAAARAASTGSTRSATRARPGGSAPTRATSTRCRTSVTPKSVDKLATITPYATGATIKDLVNEALITAIRDGREVITWRDVMKAKQLKDLGPPEDVEYIERERHAVAVHEACHAVVAYRTRQHMEIDLATIEKGSDYLGMVASIPPEDQFTRWRSEYEADILVSLASLAGERMFFEGDSSSGVSGDLESATAVASFMEGYWGMGTPCRRTRTARRLEVGSPGGGRGGPPEGREHRDGAAGRRSPTGSRTSSPSCSTRPR